jgi:DNA-binding phage protein
MALTRDFKETVMKRIQRDKTFRRELFKQGVECLLSGDVDTGKIVLRNYIHATTGFASLSEATDIPVKSLLRMFGPTGNPQAKNLFQVIAHLQKLEHVHLKLTASKAA